MFVFYETERDISFFTHPVPLNKFIFYMNRIVLMEWDEMQQS